MRRLRRLLGLDRRGGERLRGPGHRRAVRAALQPVVCGPRSRVRVSPTAVINDALINTMCGSVEIGDHAMLGHRVMLLTGTHDYRATGEARRRVPARKDRDIVIELGAWVASGATIIGPCRIGRNAVVGAGCVVDFDVPPDTLVRPSQQLTLEPITYRQSPLPAGGVHHAQ